MTLALTPAAVFSESGADNNFIDSWNWCLKPTYLLSHSLNKDVSALESKLPFQVTPHTAPLRILSGMYHKMIISSPTSPIVLGLPWLNIHNPHIDWSTTSITDWGVHYCHCLQSAVPARFTSPSSPPENIDRTSVPPPTHDPQQVISKDQVVAHTTALWTCSSQWSTDIHSDWRMMGHKSPSGLSVMWTIWCIFGAPILDMVSTWSFLLDSLMLQKFFIFSETG